MAVESGKKVTVMPEYIDRDAVYHAISVDVGLNAYEKAYCIDIVRKIPQEDADIVLHGMWLNFYGDFSTAECDICAVLYEVSPDESPRKEFFDAFKEFYKFCPNCGAKMDLKGESDDG